MWLTKVLATMTLTVLTAVNLMAQEANPQSVTTAEDTSITITLTGSAKPVFVLGETKPDATSTGAGVLRAYPTKHVYGNSKGVIYLYGTESLKDTIVHARVVCKGTNLIENCVLVGAPSVPLTTHTNMVSCSGSVLTTVRFCTIKPAAPSAYWSGIGEKFYTAERNLIVDCVDAFAVFSQTSDKRCKVNILGNYVPSMTQFRPDYANNRPESHNDCVQLQGNIDDATDVIIKGNNFIGRHSTTTGTLPTTYTQLSCVMLSPNTQTGCSASLLNNWFSGGIYTINAGRDGQTGKLRIIGNRFELPGANSPGPVKAIVIDKSVDRTVSGNVYSENGAPVPVSGG